MSTGSSVEPNAYPEVGHAPSFHLLSILATLVRCRRTLLLWSLAGFAVGLVVALTWSPYFIATAIIMPPQQSQSLTSALTAQIPQLSGGGLSGMSLKNPGDMYVGIMEGRSVTDSVIDSLHLDSVYQQKLRSGTRSSLQRAMAFESSRDGLIRITATAKTPQLAADIANSYVSALYKINSRLAITEAAQRRLFFQQQVDEAKEQLLTAENSMKAVQQKTGMIQLSGQTELLLRDIASVRSQVTSHEVKLRSLSTYASSENPEVRQTQEELQALRSQLAQLESSQKAASQGGAGAINSAGEVPAAGLEYMRKLRDLQYQESLFALLSKQFEAARLDEAKSAAVLQVVDQAVPADRKAGPSRMLIVLFCTVATGFLKGLLIVIQKLIPEFRERLRTI